MLNIANYQISELLYQSRTTRIFAARRTTDGTNVVIKLPAEGPAAQKQSARLRHEYQLLKGLDISGVIRVHELVDTPEGPALVLDDIGGQSLRGLLALGPLPLKGFLYLGLQLTDALGALHEAGVIHKDINPANIVMNPESGRACLIDAGISTRLPREAQEVRSPNQLEGTIAYVSPEQTGRMNRAIDYRSDFYALGMTFYELVTGQLAFRNSDLLELVHCHIAQTPIPPREVNLEVPEVLSAIIMKLCAKMAEERYQSAYGLRADLQKCLDSLEKDGVVASFAIGEKDVSRRLQLPQKLYGRELERAELFAAFDRVHLGATELLLVSGYSGIGKSSLVLELHKPVLAAHGYFVTGRFDQYKRDIPYAALALALGQLLRQLLLEGEARRAKWQQRIAQALVNEAPFLAGIVPEIELLLGKQPERTAADPAEHGRALQSGIRNLLCSIASPESPLVLMLDDLQWADGASLGLVRELMSSGAARSILVLGTYRDQEVGPVHPLTLLVDELRKAAVPIRELTLRPLRTADVQAIVQDTLHCAADAAQPLGTLIEQKTQGNPFFVGQLILKLHQDGLLRFDPHSGGWTWELQKIKQAQITDNVVALIVGKLHLLPSETQQVLRLAACMGSEFGLDDLTAVSERTHEQTAAALWSALQEDFVTPIGDSYDETNRRYRFLHDRVQQAAFDLIEKDAHGPLRLKIGRMLLRKAERFGTLVDQLFDILPHFAAGIDGMQDAGERLVIAELALRGGIKAKQALANEAAQRLFALGMSLLPQDAFETQHELAFALYRERAHCEGLLTHEAEAQELITTLLAQARTMPERIEAYIQRIYLFLRNGKYGDALQTGIECLRLFDLELKAQATSDDVGQLTSELKRELGARRPADLLQHPQMVDAEKRVLLQVLANLTPAAWMAGEHVFHSLCTNLGILSVRYGNTDQSAYAYVYSGMVLAVRGELELGYELGRVACKLTEQYRNDEVRGKVLLVYGMNLHYRKHSIKSSIEHLLAAFAASTQANDLLWGPIAGQAITNTIFSMGQNMREAHLEALKWLAYSRQHNAISSIDGIVSVGRFFARMLELPSHPTMTGESDGSDEAEFETQLVANPYVGFQFAHYHAKSLLHYVLNDYASALSAIAECKTWLPKATMLQESKDHAFYEALIHAALATSTSGDARERHVEKIREGQLALQPLCESAPMNFAHKHTLLEAELARLIGDNVRAGDLYDQAIARAAENGFLHHAAIANECAGRHYLALGKSTIAGAYLSEALAFYARWGARRKVTQLQHTYPLLLRGERGPQRAAAHNESTTITNEDVLGLDLLTVTRAAQAISGEIMLEQLLARMLKIVLENAGAERGFLLLRHGDGFRIEAAGNNRTDDLEVLRSLPVKGTSELSEAVVDYVAQTGEAVVLSSAATDAAHGNDRYLTSRKVKSLLCVPAHHHGKLVAMVYLENNLAAGTFTADRVELLRILSAQMAISIDNARLYANLEEKVRERTAALQESQARVLELQREATERQMAGGFAHEIRNALAGPKVLLSDIMGLRGEGDESLPLANAKVLKQVYKLCNPRLEPRDQDTLKALVLQMYGQEERLEDVLQIVYKSVSRGLSTTQNILDYSRTGQEGGSAQDVNLNDVLSQLHGELGPELHRQGLTLKMELDPQLPQVNGRPPQLRSALENIILNARDALLDTGRDPARDRVITMSTRSTEKGAQIEIADNGIGIAAEHLSRIFEPFFSTKPETGTGLGLALVKKVISLHNGHLAVSSVPSEGTRFTITL